MSKRGFSKVIIVVSCIAISQNAIATQENPNRPAGQPSTSTQQPGGQPQTEGTRRANQAEESAGRIRRAIPTLPALVRGTDGLLNIEGARATQRQLVTSTNVKDPATDALPFGGALPVEAAEPVRMPIDQFNVILPKFYSTVATSDQISTDWHFKAGSPLLSFKHGSNGLEGFRSATPGFAATGPLAGGKLLMFESFDYRLSKTSVENLFGEHADTRYDSYDWNNRFDFKPAQRHSVTARLSLFSQDLDYAGLGGSIAVEATPHYSMRGGQLTFTDIFTSSAGVFVSTTASLRRLRSSVVPQGNKPLLFIEQGETLGNYFDSMRRNSTRAELRQGARFREINWVGRHQLGIGGGIARSWFDSSHFSRTIILGGHDEDELTSITTFAGSPFESLASTEATLWGEDRWTPSPRATFNLGLRYDWTTQSRTNEWSPRLGFAILPFKDGETVIRGGVGIFYDVFPLTAATFTAGRQRVVQFFDEGEAASEPRLLSNITTREHLRTAHILAWNLEIDHEVSPKLFLRAKAEERNGRNLLLVRPNRSAPLTTALVLSDDGRSRYREFEATASYKPARASAVNFSYIRSSAAGDLNTFASVFGTIEKPFIGSNRYARSRSDSPNRFVAWGYVDAWWGVTLSPAVDVHTGFPFSFTDASNSIAPEADFGRYPRTFSLDLGVHRDFKVTELGRNGKVRLGVRVYNLTNHFNPRGVDVTEDEAEERGVVRGFFDGAGRTYRASLVFNF
ncbi:MAG TPA: TonB-dependent receptor [Blastocatellia bacterium]|nr:TonB-dependent receptor [Blastocatellia bacterium]